MELSLTWTLSDQEYAVLQRLVAAEGKGESVEEYATRVGLKGLRGTLETRVAELRAVAIDTLVEAWDAAPPQAKAASIDQLGYALQADGTILPKE